MRGGRGEFVENLMDGESKLDIGSEALDVEPTPMLYAQALLICMVKGESLSNINCSDLRSLTYSLQEDLEDASVE